MIRKALKVIMSISSVVLLGMSSSTVVFAENNPSSEEKLLQEETVDFLKEYNVDEENIDKLLDKLNAGEKWDSIEGNQITNQEYYEDENKKITIDHYEDGSIAVTEVDVSQAIIIEDTEDYSEGIINPLASVNPGTTSDDSNHRRYIGATVRHSNGLLTAQFFADFTIARRGSGTINRVYSPKVTMIGVNASVTNRRLVINRRQSSSSSPARATLTFNYSHSLAASNGYLRLNVTNSGYSAAHSF